MDKWHTQLFKELEASLDNNDYFYSVGYLYFGILLYGYARWIYKNIEAENTDQVVFIARDGYLYQKALNTLYCENIKNVKQTYFYASRISTLGARVHGDYSLQNILRCAKLRETSSLGVLLDRLEIEADEYFAACNKKTDVNESARTIFSDDEALRALEHVVCSKKHYYSEKEELFKAYVKQEIIGNRVMIIDTGWNGTIQAAIEEVSNRPYYCGKYLAVNSTRRGRLDNLKIDGYLYDESCNDRRRYMVKAMMGLMELVFSSQEGSTKSYYSDENGLIHPKLFEYEYENDPEDHNRIEMIREGALGALKWISKSRTFVDIDPYSALLPLFKLCTKPTYNDVEKLGDIKFLEGKFLELAKPGYMTEYLKKERKFIADFGDSAWKIGFMKRFFKIDMPYFLVLETLLYFSGK